MGPRAGRNGQAPPGADHRPRPSRRVRCEASRCGRVAVVHAAEALADRLVRGHGPFRSPSRPGHPAEHGCRGLSGRLGHEDPGLGQRSRVGRPTRRSDRRDGRCRSRADRFRRIPGRRNTTLLARHGWYVRGRMRLGGDRPGRAIGPPSCLRRVAPRRTGRCEGRTDDGAPVRYWSTFATDRTLYRRDDTINAWGVVRDRDTGAVPANVTVRVFASTYQGGDSEGAPLSTVEAHPNPIGAFSTSLDLSDVPEGDYVVESSGAGDIVGSSSFRVDRILKPAYRLQVATGRRVYFQGDQIRVTASATFYEGSPVPGLPLRLDGLVERSFTTGKTGEATTRATVLFDRDDQGDAGRPDIRVVSVTPARPEEGSISGASSEIVAFNSAWLFDATTMRASDTVSVTGTLSAVDRDRLEREIAGGASIWDLDVKGAPIAGKSVVATVVELIPYRTQTGTRYDFIEKKVVPVYDYGTHERAAGTVRVTTAADGSFSASVQAAGHNSYRVRLRTTDPDKRPVRWTGFASEPGSGDSGDSEPSLVRTSDPSSDGADFGIGDPIDLTMRDPGLPSTARDRYLFYTAQGGLRDAGVQSSARYQATFADVSTPGLWITGVRFTGNGYVESPQIPRLVSRDGSRDHRPVDLRCGPIRSGIRGQADRDDDGPHGPSGAVDRRPSRGRREAVRDRRRRARRSPRGALCRGRGRHRRDIWVPSRTHRARRGRRYHRGRPGREPESRRLSRLGPLQAGRHGAGWPRRRDVPRLGRPHLVADRRVGLWCRAFGRRGVDRDRRRAAVLRRCDDRTGVPRRRPTRDRTPRLRHGAAGWRAGDLRDRFGQPQAACRGSPNEGVRDGHGLATER